MTMKLLSEKIDTTAYHLESSKLRDFLFLFLCILSKLQLQLTLQMDANMANGQILGLVAALAVKQLLELETERE